MRVSEEEKEEEAEEGESGGGGARPGPALRSTLSKISRPLLSVQPPTAQMIAKTNTASTVGASSSSLTNFTCFTDLRGAFAPSSPSPPSPPSPPSSSSSFSTFLAANGSSCPSTFAPIPVRSVSIALKYGLMDIARIVNG